MTKKVCPPKKKGGDYPGTYLINAASSSSADGTINPNRFK
jgi:hypothetical protein